MKKTNIYPIYCIVTLLTLFVLGMIAKELRAWASANYDVLGSSLFNYYAAPVFVGLLVALDNKLYVASSKKCLFFKLLLATVLLITHIAEYYGFIPLQFRKVGSVVYMQLALATYHAFSAVFCAVGTKGAECSHSEGKL